MSAAWWSVILAWLATAIMLGTILGPPLVHVRPGLTIFEVDGGRLGATLFQARTYASGRGVRVGDEFALIGRIGRGEWEATIYQARRHEDHVCLWMTGVGFGITRRAALARMYRHYWRGPLWGDAPRHDPRVFVVRPWTGGLR